MQFWTIKYTAPEFVSILLCPIGRFQAFDPVKFPEAVGYKRGAAAFGVRRYQHIHRRENRSRMPISKASTASCAMNASTSTCL